jgi:integrase
MHPDTPSKWFNKFLAEKKLPHIPWHGLRHTSATLLIADGSDIREVSGRLGHADTSTTGNIYAHFLKKADQAAAEKMNTLMARRNQKQDGKANNSK